MASIPVPAYITFRMPTPAVRQRAAQSRHHERADVRTGVVHTTAQAIAYRDRVNERGYYGRAYRAVGVSEDDPRTVVSANGMRVRVRIGGK